MSSTSEETLRKVIDSYRGMTTSAELRESIKKTVSDFLASQEATALEPEAADRKVVVLSQPNLSVAAYVVVQLSPEFRLQHDCSGCQYLGSALYHDLYYCSKQIGGPTIIARWGKQENYTSGIEFARRPLRESEDNTALAMHIAYDLCQQLKLVP